MKISQILYFYLADMEESANNVQKILFKNKMNAIYAEE